MLMMMMIQYYYFHLCSGACPMLLCLHVSDFADAGASTWQISDLADVVAWTWQLLVLKLGKSPTWQMCALSVLCSGGCSNLAIVDA